MSEVEKAIIMMKEKQGIELVHIEPGCCETKMDISDGKYLNPLGIVYGGTLFTLADCSAGIAHRSLNNNVGPTIQGNIEFMRAAKCRILTCKAHVVKTGSKLDFVESIVYGEDGKELAKADFVFCV